MSTHINVLILFNLVMTFFLRFLSSGVFCFDNSYPFHTDERVFITLLTERVVNYITDDVTPSLATITDGDVGCPGRFHLTYH